MRAKYSEPVSLHSSTYLNAHVWKPAKRSPPLLGTVLWRRMNNERETHTYTCSCSRDVYYAHHGQHKPVRSTTWHHAARQQQYVNVWPNGTQARHRDCGKLHFQASELNGRAMPPRYPRKCRTCAAPLDWREKVHLPKPCKPYHLTVFIR